MSENKKKVLLALLPFWTPLIPPQGIIRIKGFLQGHGFPVTTVDANLDTRFKNLYDLYFNTLKTFIPPHKHGNFHNIANDVWREHTMAHINHTDQSQYIQLVKILVDKIFYHPITTQQAQQLNHILTQFYQHLETYIINLIEKEQPHVFGLSVYRDTLAPTVFAFRLVREKYPHIKNVMGGGIFTIQLTVGSPNMETFIHQTKDYIDKIFVGEGEGLMLKYLRDELPGDQRLITAKEELRDHERIGFAPIELFDFSDFEPTHYNYQAGQASSSCPYQCSFCNVFAFYGQHKKKAPEQTAREMIQLYQKNRIQLFFMLDSLLNTVITPLAEAFIKQDTTVYWDGYFRVDKTITPEKAMLWRQGGFYRARIGIESGSQKVLDLMHKGITVQQSKNAITCLAKAGIKTTAYIVIGHPGETEDDFQMTLDMIEELKDDIWEVECNPFTYFYSGQASGDDWAEKRRLLYPDWASQMLMARTWYVDGIPTREELYHRVHRFAQHCRRLEVDTPWSLKDVNNSDLRWKRLHKNAVPSVLELIKKDTYIDECKHQVQLVEAQNIHQEIGDFDF